MIEQVEKGRLGRWKKFGLAGRIRLGVLVGYSMSDKAPRLAKVVSVSERNLQNAAIRLLPKHNKLVSPEVDYLRRVLGEKATQQQIDEKVQQVRTLPWSEIVRE